MGYGVVCISSQDGAEASEAAGVVAQALGFRLIDEDIVTSAALKAGVDHSVVADAERRKSVLVRLLEGMAPGAAASAPVPLAPESLGYGQPASDELRDLIRSVIEETATAGQAVLVAHAASFALAQHDDVLRVFITASEPTRQRRVAAQLGVDEKEAARVLKRSDAGRADYIKRFYGISAEQPTHYDLVINTDKITAAGAAKLILEVAVATPGV